MANRVLVQLSYSKKVLIDADQLPTLMEILEGATLTEYEYVGGERVDYIADEPFHLEFSNTSGLCYKTEKQFQDIKEQAQLLEKEAEE